MKKYAYLILSFLFIFVSAAQTPENLIVIKTNSIELPGAFDFGTIAKGGQIIEKIIIENDSENVIDIKNLKAPSGYIVSVSKKSLKPNNKVTLIIGLDSNCVKEKGNFSEQIIIETNLVQNIIIDIKGVYL